MKPHKILLALVLSLPLVPFLFLSADSLTQEVTAHDLILAAPFVLEFMGYYVVYGFTHGRYRRFTMQERKLLLVLGAGFFILLAVPVIIGAAVKPDPQLPFIATMLLIWYAFGNMLWNIHQTSETSDRIGSYFARRYLIPGAIAIALTVGLLLTTSVVVNTVAAYYILKNFTSFMPTKNIRYT